MTGEEGLYGVSFMAPTVTSQLVLVQRSAWLPFLRFDCSGLPTTANTE
jgi:hypothetical protein